MKYVYNPQAQKKKLRLLLVVFFLLITIPVYFLIQTLYGKLDTEAYFTARHEAEKLLDRLELKLQDLLIVEQQRPSTEYSFFNVLQSPLLNSSTIKFSPLSQFPPQTNISGMVGYFQINPDGSFHIPALPELDNGSGLSAKELENRLALKQRLQNLLTRQQSSDKALEPRHSAKKQSQKTRDLDDQYIVGQSHDDMKQEINKSIVEKKSADSFRPSSADEHVEQKKDKLVNKLSNQYQTRKEQVQLPDQSMASSFFKRKKSSPIIQEKGEAISEQEPVQMDNIRLSETEDMINILRFETEVTPLQLLLINRDYFCFYRYVWNDNNRYTQGFVVNIHDFFAAILEPLFLHSKIDRLLLQYNGAVLEELVFLANSSQKPLYSRLLNTPFNQLKLIVYGSEIYSGSGRQIIDILTVSIVLTLLLGLVFFYRLLSKQIDLSRQQQNFISAVSHELKTPLTSIRMYGEMLRSGWVLDEIKKQQCYDFIFFESERLSRLIANVLQLARINHRYHNIEIKAISPQLLLTRISAKIAAQQEATSFQINIDKPAEGSEQLEIKVDEDAFFQIIINLVDNALKFAAKSERKQIDIGLRLSDNKKQVVFYVRDYGPGIKKQQINKIFQLFYRVGDELTRSSPGTGIGLALVAQLTEAMNAKVGVVNCQPGVEFQIKFTASLLASG